LIGGIRDSSISLVAEYEEINARPYERDEEYQQDQHRFGEVVMPRSQHIADGDDVENDYDQGEEHVEE
jgi:hypothetical protein